MSRHRLSASVFLASLFLVSLAGAAASTRSGVARHPAGASTNPADVTIKENEQKPHN